MTEVLCWVGLHIPGRVHGSAPSWRQRTCQLCGNLTHLWFIGTPRRRTR